MLPRIKSFEKWEKAIFPKCIKRLFGTSFILALFLVTLRIF